MRRTGWEFGGFVILVISAAICGCMVMRAQRSQAPVRDETGPYQIAGVLVNAVTGEPVRRGLVQALDDTGQAVASSVTNRDGGFSLSHLGNAKYQLTASKRGFRTQAYDEHDEFASSIVTGPDQDTTHLNFKLMPNAVVFGMVTDENGDPVANARVMLFRRSKHSGMGEKSKILDVASTDDTGTYEIGDLAAGEYLLAVVAEPWYALHAEATSRQNGALDVAYPVTYFDSTTEERSATPIQLTGGMRQEANLSLHAVPALHISVPAPPSANGAAANAQMQQVVLGNVLGEVDNYSYSNETGMLTVNGLAPGNYQLQIHGDSQQVMDLSLSSSQQVDLASASNENTISGRLRMLSGGSVPEQMALTLERVDDGTIQGPFATEVRDGRFKIEQVPPGEYAISATAGDKAMAVVAVGMGARQHAGNSLSVRDRMPELTVMLSSAETRIEGFAERNGKGFAGAMMVLLPRSAALWKELTRRDQSDTDGSFAFRDVAPGQYTAVAIEDGWPLDWTDAATMARFLPAGTNVTVKVNSGKQIRFDSPIAVQER